MTKGKFTKYTDEYDKPVVQVQEKANWQLIKESKSQSGLRLEGATFVLKNDESLYYGSSIADDSNTAGEDEKGYIEWKDDDGQPIEENKIPAGTYILEETKAPIGYSLSNVKWQVTIKNMEKPEIVPIDSDGKREAPLESKTENGTFIFIITNMPVYSLPSAGGTGIFLYTIGGVLLLMAGSLILYKMKCGEVLKK